MGGGETEHGGKKKTTRGEFMISEQGEKKSYTLLGREKQRKKRGLNGEMQEKGLDNGKKRTCAYSPSLGALKFSQLRGKELGRS